MSEELPTLPSLFNQPTELEADKLKLNEFLALAANRYYDALKTQSAAYNWLWALPTERLLTLLNENAMWSVAMLTANRGATEANNLVQDLNGDPSKPLRGETESGRPDIIFNPATELFEVVANP